MEYTRLGTSGLKVSRIAHPVREELPEGTLVACDADDLAIAESGDSAGQGVAAAGEVALLQIPLEDQAGGIRDRSKGRAATRDPQPAADLLEHAIVIREDDVFLGPVVAEERGPAKAGALGDVLHAGLLIPPFVEEGERGAGEPVSC